MVVKARNLDKQVLAPRSDKKIPNQNGKLLKRPERLAEQLLDLLQKTQNL